MYLATLRVYRPLHAVSVAGVAAVIIGTHASVGSVGVSEAPGACNAVPLANIVFGGLDHGPPVAAEGPDHLQPPAGRTRPEVAPGPVVAPTRCRRGYRVLRSTQLGAVGVPEDKVDPFEVPSLREPVQVGDGLSHVFAIP